MNTNPARGMRDFLPSDVRRRNYVIGIIKEVYEKYGFEPLETPSVENLDTLTNKYGEEGDQLMFKILKRGEKLQTELSEIGNENDLTDLALRYDLTVPLARVVANYKNDLPKFFKRYQIQPVWRADRPARGRFREFYQCDVDAIGSKSMLVEAELIEAVCDILLKLGFEDFTIRINHRDILGGMMEVAEIPSGKRPQALAIIDKLDKIGLNGIKKELLANDFAEESVRIITHQIENQMNLHNSETNNYEYNLQILSETSSPAEEFAADNESMKSYWDAKKSLREIIKYTEHSAARNYIKVDESLARGLSYYTGAIFEVNVTDLAGSIAGGGRYDNLVGMFGKEEIPAVGFSLGLERILLIMEEKRMFPESLTANSADVMITIWNEETCGESLKLANDLRQKGLRVLVYPEADKLGKQFKYADSINIPFVCILGESELAENKVAVKNMKSGEQNKIERNELSKEHFYGTPSS